MLSKKYNLSYYTNMAYWPTAPIPVKFLQKKQSPAIVNSLNNISNISNNPLWLTNIMGTKTVPWTIQSVNETMTVPIDKQKKSMMKQMATVKDNNLNDMMKRVENGEVIDKSMLKLAMQWLDDATIERKLAFLDENGAKMEGVNYESQKTWWFKDVIAWSLASAVSLPKIIADSWLINKPADYIARSPVWDVIRSGAKWLFGEEAVKQYQQENIDKGVTNFSDFTQQPMMWEDQNSKLYKWSETAGDVIQIASALPALFKWWAKLLAKKKAWKILNVIQEWQTAAEKRLAVASGRLTQWVKPWLLTPGRKSIVQATQKSKDAAIDIVKDIKNPSTNPTKLFWQLKSRVWEIWTQLEGKLKEVSIPKGSVKTVSNTFNELASEVSDISTTVSKRINQLSQSVQKATNADDFRKSLQRLDDMIPSNIKKGKNLSGKDEIIYRAWRWAREAGNKFLDEIPFTDANVKSQFKKMTNLYHAMWNISSRGAEAVNYTTKIPSQRWWTIKKTLWWLALWWWLYALWKRWWSSSSNYISE